MTDSSWLRTPAPAARLGVVRVLVASYALGWLLLNGPNLLGLIRADSGRFDPVGVLGWLSEPVPPALAWTVLAAAIVSAAGYAVGVAPRVSGPACALTFLVVSTYRNSWGQVFHTENLPALFLLVLAITPAADAWSWSARDRPAPPDDERYGWPLRVLAVLTASTYVLAAWAKLRLSGTSWVFGDALRNHVAQDTLLKDLFGDWYSPVTSVLLEHAWLFPPMALAALTVELAAPVALLGGRWRDVWVAAAWLFHVAILVVMATFFPFQLLGIAFAPMFAVERLPGRLTRLSRGAGSAPATR